MNDNKIINIKYPTYEPCDAINYCVFRRERFEVRNLVNEIYRAVFLKI